MTTLTTDKYSAGEQGLGYIYQVRLALLHLLRLPEDTAVFLETDDDLDFIDSDGGKSLASIKHKAVGDRLTDLSTDFWKSVEHLAGTVQARWPFCIEPAFLPVNHGNGTDQLVPRPTPC